MTTLRHNYLPDLQEQFSYDDKVTLWIDKETGDLHIRTEKGSDIIPNLIGIRILDLLVKQQEIYREGKRLDWADRIYRKLIL
jgi:hypothetical protein